MIVTNTTRNTILCDRCQLANSFWKRLIGLLNRKALLKGEGLLFDRCQGIHTFGMRFAIDLVWLDKDLRVMQTTTELPPFRTAFQRKAHFVVELPPGTIRGTHTAVGDNVQLRDKNVAGS